MNAEKEIEGNDDGQYLTVKISNKKHFIHVNMN